MKHKSKIRLLRMALAVITIACLLPVAQSCCLSVMHERQQRQLKAQKTEDSGQNQQVNQEDIRNIGDSAQSPEEGRQILAQLASLYRENNDLVGWLTIEGTKIDYPVMQCKDNEYYLNHNFQKEEDRYGCLFVKSIADIDTPGTNAVIYGHQMKDGSMFGDLDQYESGQFYREHEKITFDTLYEEREYQVMAVFFTQVSGKDDDEFRYYQFYEAKTEEEFLDFYKNVKAMSIYDTGVTAEFGDTFLTLSTCSGYAENGRFVVVAKRIGK